MTMDATNETILMTKLENRMETKISTESARAVPSVVTIFFEYTIMASKEN